MTYKIITGLITNGTVAIAQPIAVRFTSDKVGETLSLGNDEDIQITVPFEVIDKMIQQERSKK